MDAGGLRRRRTSGQSPSAAWEWSSLWRCRWHHPSKEQQSRKCPPGSNRTALPDHWSDWRTVGSRTTKYKLLRPSPTRRPLSRSRSPARFPVPRKWGSHKPYTTCRASLRPGRSRRASTIASRSRGSPPVNISTQIRQFRFLPVLPRYIVIASYWPDYFTIYCFRLTINWR